MKDFFARQEDARRQTGRLLFLFVLAVTAVVSAVYLLAAFLYFFVALKNGTNISLWQPSLFLWTTLATLAVVMGTSIWRIMQLREGGASLAVTLGGSLVPPHTNDPKERLLRNVMEEMAIASGVPVPELYLLEKERGINAFAAGIGPRDAVICVTRGAAELLSRDELQGVMAHEFSHILNGDVLLNIRLLGWLGGIQAVAQTGKVMVNGVRHARGRGAGAALCIGGALYVIGYIGHFFAQLIKSAVSVQREYLADASAVQFTRNPEGLAGALRKIGGLGAGSRLNHPRAIEMSHMFFGDALEESWLPALATHPPLKERIRRLEPRFSGIFPKVAPLPIPETEKMPQAVARPKTSAAAAQPLLSGAAIAALLETVGDPMQQHLDMARRLLGTLTPPLRDATRTPLGAAALSYGLLLDADQAIRKRQVELVTNLDGHETAACLERIAPELDLMPLQVRLPLLDLAIPALRRLTPAEYQRFRKTTDALSTADRRLSVFELTLRHLLQRHLDQHFSPAPFRAAQIYALRGVEKECSCVLTTLARVGNRDEVAAAAAFASGATLLNEKKTELVFLPAEECTGASLQHAFGALERTSPLIKKKLLAACLAVLEHDQVVKVDEVELFRGVADAIGCPVPPWLAPLPDWTERHCDN
ncbi:M48 family metallopeptidase [Geomonas oryzae]|uniref:M48 family metallopeptidase n=1 Tax=Geomonas oryzae TaxID=2364273 RepID=UPI00100BF640|nr:M48 family metallopeptidase [Geomonas oryzae]